MVVKGLDLKKEFHSQKRYGRGEGREENPVPAQGEGQDTAVIRG